MIVNGVTLTALASGALWWSERAILIVADLHLEKGSAFARSGQFLPPYDSAETLRRLAGDIAAFGPKGVIALGDSFHDAGGPARLGAADREALACLVKAVDWLWIAGNHDPSPSGPWGGRVAGESVIGPLVFRHEALPGPPGAVRGEISGHFHPKAAVRTRARRIQARCFVEDGLRLILPAYGAYAGGLDVRDPAISGLLKRDFDVHLLSARGPVTLPRARLAADW